MNEANIIARLEAEISVAHKRRKNSKHTNNLSGYYFFEGESSGLGAAIRIIEAGGKQPEAAPNSEAIASSLERAGSTAKELLERIGSYLGNGGLFNPECMEHEKVRDLLMDCREWIEWHAPSNAGAEPPAN